MQSYEHKNEINQKFYLQHDCWVSSNFIMRGYRRKTSTVNFGHFYRTIEQGLSNMCPDGFYSAAVCTPWRIKLHEPHALMAYIDELIT